MTASPGPYRGRFAPSPTGPLHAGSLVAALASWLDARSHGGRWLVRMEDVDTPRCIPGMDQLILQQLADCALLPDEPVQWQSRRGGLYQAALDQLISAKLAYPCACSRQDIEQAQARLGRVRLRNVELPYPGTCRAGLHGKVGRAWRFNTQAAMTEWTAHSSQATPSPPPSPASGRGSQHPDLPPAAGSATVLPPLPPAGEGWGEGEPIQQIIPWQDRRLGPQQQDVCHTIGDFILHRADGLWAYQLAVVVDDAAQGITHVVRGQDLADNTARQILLQTALGLARPQYLHTPLVLGPDGEKLSKQNGAQALNTRVPLACLNAAATVLGLTPQNQQVSEALAHWLAQWRALLSRWEVTA